MCLVTFSIKAVGWLILAICESLSEKRLQIFELSKNKSLININRLKWNLFFVKVHMQTNHNQTHCDGLL